LGELCFDSGAAGADLGLVGFLLGEGFPQGDDVVGEQPEPGVPQFRLDDRGAAGQFRLAAERFELAAQLRDQVTHPVEVALHRGEFPQRFLFAFAVFEDARGFFNERTALLRSGVQHRVELPLADDDVHLPADTGVAEQFLDVEEAAGVAVDGVL